MGFFFTLEKKCGVSPLQIHCNFFGTTCVPVWCSFVLHSLLLFFKPPDFNISETQRIFLYDRLNFSTAETSALWVSEISELQEHSSHQLGCEWRDLHFTGYLGVLGCGCTAASSTPPAAPASSGPGCGSDTPPSPMFQVLEGATMTQFSFLSKNAVIIWRLHLCLQHF